MKKKMKKTVIAGISFVIMSSLLSGSFLSEKNIYASEVSEDSQKSETVVNGDEVDIFTEDYTEDAVLLNSDYQGALFFKNDYGEYQELQSYNNTTFVDVDEDIQLFISCQLDNELIHGTKVDFYVNGKYLGKYECGNSSRDWDDREYMISENCYAIPFPNEYETLPSGKYYIDIGITLANGTEMKRVSEGVEHPEKAYRINRVGKYKICYDANGGEEAPEPQNKCEDVSIQLSKTVPYRNEYVFRGWSIEKNATTADFQPGTLYSTNGSITLYAVWEKEMAMENEFTYVVNDDGTASIKSYTGTDTEVIIPSSIDGYKVTGIWGSTGGRNSNGLKKNKNLKSVTIPEGVVSIGNGAFFEDDNLETINIPSTVTFVGDRSFSGTKWMTNRQNENPLVIVNDLLVDGTKAVGDIALPGNVKEICSRAFSESGITGLNTSNVKIIREFALFDSKITNLVVGSAVKEIERSAFVQCRQLENVRIKGACQLEQCVFSDCTSLKNIEIDQMLTLGSSRYTNYEAASIFSCCDSIETLKVPLKLFEDFKENYMWDFKDAKLKQVDIIDEKVFYDKGVLYTADKKKLIWYPSTLTNQEYSILEGTEIIGGWAFSPQKYLKHITIPDSVKEIRRGAFYECQLLENVIIPDSVDNVNTAELFGKCPNLKNVVLSPLMDHIIAIESKAWTPLTFDYDNNIIIYSNPDLTLNTVDTPTGPIWHGSISEVKEKGGLPNWDFKDYIYCKFDANGGEVKKGRQAIIPNDKYWTLPIPQKAGYSFLGWYTTKTGGTKVTNNSVVVSNETHTLYAHWKKNLPSRYLDDSEIYSFSNSYIHFGNGKYYITDKDFQKLADSVRILYKNNNNMANSVINSMQSMRDSLWGGSCYGMAVTTILDKLNAIGFNENFDPSAQTMSRVKSPSKNQAVKSAINYYHLAQKIPYLRNSNCKYYSKNYSDWKAGLKQLVSMSQDGEPLLFCYSYRGGGHAIVIKGYEEGKDGSHNIIAYDNRYPTRDVIIKIDRNYSSCIIDGDEDAYVIEYIENMKSFETIDIDGVNNKYYNSSFGNTKNTFSSLKTTDMGLSFTNITVRSEGKVTIENAEGETLIVENGQSSGTMDVANRRLIISTKDSGEDESAFVFTVNNSDSYTFESSTEEMYVSVQCSELFGEASTKNANYVVISKKDGVFALGNDFSYRLSLSVNNKMCDMVSISGDSDNDVKLMKKGDHIKATGVDTEDGVVTVYSNTVNADNYSYDNGYNSFVISPTDANVAGHINILGSSNDNGVYDVNIGGIESENLKTIEAASVTGLNAKEYTGRPQKPTLKVKLGNTLLKNGTDYTVTYFNNTNVGTATVTITGKGNYTGKLEKTFVINPAAPEEFIIGGKAVDALRVNWTKAAGATGYVIEQYQNGVWRRIARIGQSDTVTYRATGLTSDTTYKFRIKSFAFQGKKPYYSGYRMVSGTTIEKGLSKVTGVKIGGRASDALRLNWTRNNGVSGYIIEQMINGKWQRIVRIGENTSVTYRIGKLKPSTNYQFRIRAFVLDGGKARYSKYTDISGRTLPSPVSGLKIGGTTKDALRLNWTKNSGASGYIIEQKINGKWTRIGRISNNDIITYRITNLKAGTTYRFRVRAFAFDGGTAIYSGYKYLSGTTKK